MFYGPWPVVPSLKVRVGSEVKKEGETLTWEVLEIDDYTVVLKGPAGRKGHLVLSRDDFNKDWVRA